MELRGRFAQAINFRRKGKKWKNVSTLLRPNAGVLGRAGCFV
jgi:hypothetical protein